MLRDYRHESYYSEQLSVQEITVIVLITNTVSNLYLRISYQLICEGI